MDNNDIEIEIIDDNNIAAGGEQLPLNFITIGEVESDDLRIYIKQGTYKALEEYACSDTSRELGTFLIGEYLQEMGKTHLIISDYIEAKYTDATASTLTFTHETWQYVYKEKERLYPNKKIIGWQHTHPNYGIFLSSYDIFIQENFFNLEFQTAYVIDPIENLRGFFQWKNGKLEKLKGFYIYDEVGKVIKIPQKKINSKGGAVSLKNHSRLIPVILSMLLISTIALGATAISMNNKYKNLKRELSSAQEEIKEKDDALEAQNGILEEVQGVLENKTISKDNSSVLGDLIKKLEASESKIANKAELIKSLKALEGKASEEDFSSSVYFKTYEVKAGDSLTSICLENGVDYYDLKEVIAAINGIENPNIIKAGQVIILPIINENNE